MTDVPNDNVGNPRALALPRAIPWTEAPDFMDLNCLLALAGIYKCWRVPACCGLLGMMCSGLCWEQRALNRRRVAESAGNGSLVWSLLGIGVGVYYFFKGSGQDVMKIF